MAYSFFRLTQLAEGLVISDLNYMLKQLLTTPQIFDVG